MDHWICAQKWTEKYFLHVQAGSVDKMEIARGINALQKYLQSFTVDHIYNMDETGLFYRLLPRKSYVYKEDRNKTRGTKSMKAKDRIKIIIETSDDGSHLLPPAIIGTAKSPKAFKLRKCPLPYLAQKKAWNDSFTCQKWFAGTFLPAIRKRTSQPIALVMDNASSHGFSLIYPNGQVKIVYLPPNCTSVHQPMDCVIIAAVKVRYRYNVLEKTAALLENRDTLRQAFKSWPSGTKVILEGYLPLVLDACEMVKQVWHEMKQTTVARCWIKSAILPPYIDADLCNAFGKRTDRLDEKETGQLIEGMLNISLDAAKIRTDDVDSQRMASDIICVSTEKARKWATVESAPEAREALETEFLEEIETELRGDVEGEGHNTRGAASDGGDNKDRNRLMGDSIATCASFSTVAECFSKLESTEIACNSEDASFCLRRARQMLLKALHPKRKRLQSTLSELF